MNKKGWSSDDFSVAAVPEKLFFFFWPNLKSTEIYAIKKHQSGYFFHDQDSMHIHVKVQVYM